MDFNRTLEIYKNFGQEKKFKEKPDNNRFLKEQGWYEKVKSKRTGEYNQATDLIAREAVSQDWKPPRTDLEGKPVEYPFKEVSEIIRKRTLSGEWVLSRTMMYGLDNVGNEINVSMNDKECFDDALPVYKLVPEDPKADPRFKNTKMKPVIDRLEPRIKYTLQYSPDSIQQLYDLKNGKCGLVLIDESGGDHPPVGNIPFEHFKGMPFEDLWQESITPKYKMDRSYGDNLDNSHIG